MYSLFLFKSSTAPLFLFFHIRNNVPSSAINVRFVCISTAGFEASICNQNQMPLLSFTLTNIEEIKIIPLSVSGNSCTEKKIKTIKKHYCPWGKCISELGLLHLFKTSMIYISEALGK